MKKTIHVTGMACKHCAGKVCDKAKSLAGVKKAEVDLESAILTVEFDENTVTAKKIADAVTAAGYPASEE